jgi:hypothetical protein
MVLPSFGLFGQAVSEEKNFFKLTNQKQELPVAAMLVNGSGRGIHILIFFLVHLAKGNVSFCHHLSSVNFSHFNLLL